MMAGDGVSDLLFTVGKPPFVEAHGCLNEFKTPTAAFGSEQIDRLVEHFINGDERLMSDLANWGSCDCSYALQDIARVRVNIFNQNGRHALVMRKLPSEIPTLEKLRLPPVFREIIKEKPVIVFVTRTTGSGKTTTRARIP